MLNTIYRLTSPRQFVAEYTDIDINDSEVLVRPTHLSICNADQRYYQGTRAPEVLKQKLPMALIHEGIGTVTFDPKGEFKTGQSVVMVPNTPYESDEIIAENYLRSSTFRASGFDGFMQNLVAIRRDRIVELPENIDKNVAAFTEFVSVAWHAINRFNKKAHSRRNHVGFWGDGNLAYVTSLLFKSRFPETEINIFGIDHEKMKEFVFANNTFDVSEIPNDIELDHAFECIGGPTSGTGINQIIDYIKPEGTISILGVSEEPVPINTRMVLEKGLTIFGSSRSGVADFRDVIDFYSCTPTVVNYLSKIINKSIIINSIDDMNHAFDEDIHKPGGKTIMLWDI